MTIGASKKLHNHQGMTMVVLLLALLIVGFMCYFALRGNQKPVSNSDQKFFQDSGVDISSYKGILDSAREVVKNAEATRNFPE